MDPPDATRYEPDRLERESVMRRYHRIALMVTVGAVLVLLLAPTAATAAPERETLTFSETFQDEFLTQACGVEVTLTITGRTTFLTFPDRPVGPQDLIAYHIDILATAHDTQVRFRDVGIDLVRVAPDGTVILMATGQVPYEVTGVLKINPATGEVILEPHPYDTTRLCRFLTG
jgi:hypothetical protein